MNAISKLFQTSTTAVLKWIRNFAKKQTPKTMLSSGTPIVLELDDMWHYPKEEKAQVKSTSFSLSQHVQTKVETYQIERNDCAMRYWFGRFKQSLLL